MDGPPLAQGAELEQLFLRVLPWVAALVAAVVVLAVGLTYYKRRHRRADESGQPVWDLQNLRDMHAQGLLTDDEFERLKAQAVAQLRGASTGDTTAADGNEKPGSPSSDQ